MHLAALGRRCGSRRTDPPPRPPDAAGRRRTARLATGPPGVF